MTSRHDYIELPEERRRLALFRSAGVAIFLALLLAIAFLAPGGHRANEELSAAMPATSPAAQNEQAMQPRAPSGVEETLGSAPVIDWMQQSASHG